MLIYDNLKDAHDKLYGTICMYDGKAAMVREVNSVNLDDKPPFTVTLKVHDVRNSVVCGLDDPRFSFRNYNIGYANQGPCSVWWYRKPIKQYQQGLKSSQLSHVYSKPEFYGHARWDYCKSISDMLEGKYPTKDEVAERLRAGDSLVIGFHRDMAASWDALHRDFIIEYRGKTVGQTSNFKDIFILDDYKHLTEAIREAS